MAKRYSEEQLEELELHLAGTLRPVTPSREIVQRLKTRIQFPAREDIVNKLNDWRRLFFVFSGVLSGMVLLITVARALYYLFGRRNTG